MNISSNRLTCFKLVSSCYCTVTMTAGFSFQKCSNMILLLIASIGLAINIVSNNSIPSLIAPKLILYDSCQMATNISNPNATSASAVYLPDLTPDLDITSWCVSIFKHKSQQFPRRLHNTTVAPRQLPHLLPDCC